MHNRYQLGFARRPAGITGIYEPRRIVFSSFGAARTVLKGRKTT